MVRPWDDNWVGRLKAVARVAETKAEYLKVTHAPEQHVTEANHEVQELQQRLQSVSEKRLHARSEAKRKMPAEVITIEEQKELARQSQTIRAATTARQISVTNEPLPLQAVFDFRKSPVEQLALDFYIPRAEKVAGKQIDTKDRKPKAKSEIKSESTELRPEKNVAESLIPGKEIPYEIQIQQTKAREQESRNACYSHQRAAADLTEGRGDPQPAGIRQSAVREPSSGAF
jgi:hypothetical protein